MAHRASGIGKQLRISDTHMYVASQDNYMYPFPSIDCVAICHPGQVPQRGSRALLNFPKGTLFYRASRDPERI
jgi:hypothetical protein